MFTAAQDSQSKLDIDLQDFQARMQADMKDIFADFIAQFRRESQGSHVSQDVHSTNVSLPAPPVVLGIGTLKMGPAGGETGRTCSLAVHGLSRPTGELQSGTQEPTPQLPSTNIELPSSVLASASSGIFLSPSLPSVSITSNLRSLGYHSASLSLGQEQCHDPPGLP